MTWSNRPWALDAVPGGQRRPFYIAIGGPSGAGKSTLVHTFDRLLADGGPSIAIDERETHHPFMDRLFHDPANYAFEVQLNFMLQRCLLVKRWLDRGTSVVMERCHAEDPVFVRFLAAQGLVTPAQHELYMEVWAELDARTPVPDRVILLDIEPAVSIERLRLATASGERSQVFPDEETRDRWVTSWCDEYRQLAGSLAEDGRYAPALRVVSGLTPSDLQEYASTVLAELGCGMSPRPRRSGCSGLNRSTITT